jgi:hypothetical protein
VKAQAQDEKGDRTSAGTSSSSSISPCARPLGKRARQGHNQPPAGHTVAGYGSFTRHEALEAASRARATLVLAPVQAPIAQLSETATLFKALGGGWWNRQDVTAATRTVSACNSPE